MTPWGWLFPAWVMASASLLAAAAAIIAARLQPEGPSWRPWAMALAAVASVMLAPLVWTQAGGGIHIVPPWPALPFYSVVRAVPSKEVGVLFGLTLPGLIAAALWLWERGAAQFRRPAGIVLLAVLCAAWLTLFIGGTKLPDAPVFGDDYGSGNGLNSWLTLTRAAVIYVYGYLLWFLFWPRPSLKARV